MPSKPAAVQWTCGFLCSCSLPYWDVTLPASLVQHWVLTPPRGPTLCVLPWLLSHLRPLLWIPTASLSASLTLPLFDLLLLALCAQPVHTEIPERSTVLDGVSWLFSTQEGGWVLWPLVTKVTTCWVTLQIYLLHLSPSLSVTSSVPLCQSLQTQPFVAIHLRPCTGLPFIPLLGDSCHHQSLPWKNTCWADIQETAMPTSVNSTHLDKFRKLWT